MSHSGLTFGTIALAVAGGCSTSASARDVVVDAERSASRIVLVTQADLSSPDHLASLHRKLRTAAREVCDEQYPRDVYAVLRACSSASFRDATDQLRMLNSKGSAGQFATSGRLAIALRSH